MRYYLLFLILLASLPAFAQKSGHFSVALQLQPELTFHKNQYAYRSREVNTKTTFNTGIEATAQYYLSDRFYTELGLGFISRKLNTLAFFNQNAIPPPRQSPTQELVGTGAVAFRTIQVPVNFGYDFIRKKNWDISCNAGITGNYLLNTYYEVIKKYEGPYKKNYWQGYAVNLGFGGNYTIARRLQLTGRLTYAAINTVQDDDYLFSQDENVIPLPHTYLRLSAGLRMPL